MFGGHSSAHELEELMQRMDRLVGLLGVESEESEAAVATKSGRRAERDHHGRRLEKPFALAGAEPEPEDGGPRRDSSGKRRFKRFDPRRFARRGR